MLEKIKKDDYARLMKKLNFYYFPRVVGNPMQEVATNMDEFWNFVMKWNGIGPLFTSHNYYRTIEISITPFGNKISPSEVYITSLLFDFDYAKDIDKARKDAKKLSDFLYDNDIKHHVRFTGGKGYQLEIHFSPVLFEYKVGKSADTLSMLVRIAQNYFVDKLNLKTYDAQLNGDVKRLRRLEYSYYVKNEERNGNICFPLTREQLDMSADEHIEYSKEPLFTIPEVEGKDMTFLQIFEYLGIDVNEEKYKTAQVINDDIDVSNTNSMFKGFIALLRKEKPCILNQMMSINPPHKARVYFALFAKRIGISKEDFEEIYLTLADKVGYVDVFNERRRKQNINSIFNNPKYVREPNCWKLKADGYCIGEKCPKYRVN